MQRDQKDNFNKKRGEQKNKNLNDLQKAIRSRRISFEIWEKKNADGKGSGQFDFTSLLGSDETNKCIMHNGGRGCFSLLRLSGCIS